LIFLDVFSMVSPDVNNNESNTITSSRRTTSSYSTVADNTGDLDLSFPWKVKKTLSLPPS
jgi:hypothetical protein